MLRYVTMRVGSLLVMTGLLIIVLQSIIWLRFGYWSSLGVWTLWRAAGGTLPDWPTFSGGERIAIWILRQPLSAVVALAGVLLKIGAGRIWTSLGY